MEKQKFHLVLSLAISITLIHASPLPDRRDLVDALDIHDLVTTIGLTDGTATNNSLSSGSTSYNQPTPVKVTVTCIAGLAIALVAVTHWLLMASSSRLLNGFYLPRRALGANMEAILRKCWPRTIYSVPEDARRCKDADWDSWPILLFTVDHGGRQAGIICQKVKRLLSNFRSEPRIKSDKSPEIDGAHVGQGELTADHKFSVVSGYSELGQVFEFHDSRAEAGLEAALETAPAVWAPTASLAPRNMVHMVIWEWIAFWLAVLMSWNTLLYNGFIGGATLTSDRYPRLFLVSVYILTYLVLSLYSWYALLGIYKCLAEQATWSRILQAGFYLMSPRQPTAWLRDEHLHESDEREGEFAMSSFKIDFPGSAKRERPLEQTYHANLKSQVITYDGREEPYLAVIEEAGKVQKDLDNSATEEQVESSWLIHNVIAKYIFYPKGRAQGGPGHLTPKATRRTTTEGSSVDNIAAVNEKGGENGGKHNDTEEARENGYYSSFLEAIKAEQEANSKAFEKATELALDRTVVNATLLLGICLSIGFASWTESPLTGATSAQVGSYALLLSTSTAIGVLFTIFFHLGNMKSCAEAAVRLTELAIAVEFDSSDIGLTGLRPGHTPKFGFSAAGGSNNKRRFQTPSRSIKVSRFWWESTTIITPKEAWVEREESSLDLGESQKMPLSSRAFYVALTVLWRALAGLLFGPGFALLPFSHGDGGATL